MHKSGFQFTDWVYKLKLDLAWNAHRKFKGLNWILNQNKIRKLIPNITSRRESSLLINKASWKRMAYTLRELYGVQMGRKWSSRTKHMYIHTCRTWWFFILASKCSSGKVWPNKDKKRLGECSNQSSIHSVDEDTLVHRKSPITVPATFNQHTILALFPSTF